jgi:hypothetical protein
VVVGTHAPPMAFGHTMGAMRECTATCARLAVFADAELTFEAWAGGFHAQALCTSYAAWRHSLPWL